MVVHFEKSFGYSSNMTSVSTVNSTHEDNSNKNKLYEKELKT